MGNIPAYKMNCQKYLPSISLHVLKRQLYLYQDTQLKWVLICIKWGWQRHNTNFFTQVALQCWLRHTLHYHLLITFSAPIHNCYILTVNTNCISKWYRKHQSFIHKNVAWNTQVTQCWIWYVHETGRYVFLKKQFWPNRRYHVGIFLNIWKSHNKISVSWADCKKDVSVHTTNGGMQVRHE